VATGRGGYCAAAGVLLVLLAAVLAGRRLAHPPTATGAGPALRPGVGPEPVLDWPWQRPEAADGESPGTPLELTVSAADAFTPLTDGHDAYRRPDAISG
jgi:hypothetical protein